MAGFLDQMAAGSRARLAEAVSREPLAALRARCAELPPPPALRLDGRFDLIAELKLRSPALGTLGRAQDGLVARVKSYAGGGAAAVSVLTEPDRFDGSLAHLEAAAAALAPLGVPAMRKDFLVDPYQLHEARAAGAGGALLIVRMLSRDSLVEMLDCARELGLFVLLEAFDEEDLALIDGLEAMSASRRGWEPARRSGHAGEVARATRSERVSSGRASEAVARPDPARVPGTPSSGVLVGVNCRDLQTLEVVPQRFAALAASLPAGLPRVAESGLESAADVERAVRAGYDVALVGGALMRAGEPGEAVRAMLAAGRAAAP
jgi:indole-3-glycerol phosphate synthase